MKSLATCPILSFNRPWNRCIQPAATSFRYVTLWACRLSNHTSSMEFGVENGRRKQITFTDLPITFLQTWNAINGSRKVLGPGFRQTVFPCDAQGWLAEW